MILMKGKVYFFIYSYILEGIKVMMPFNWNWGPLISHEKFYCIIFLKNQSSEKENANIFLHYSRDFTIGRLWWSWHEMDESKQIRIVWSLLGLNFSRAFFSFFFSWKGPCNCISQRQRLWIFFLFRSITIRNSISSSIYSIFLLFLFIFIFQIINFPFTKNPSFSRERFNFHRSRFGIFNAEDTIFHFYSPFGFPDIGVSYYQ